MHLRSVIIFALLLLLAAASHAMPTGKGKDKFAKKGLKHSAGHGNVKVKCQGGTCHAAVSFPSEPFKLTGLEKTHSSGSASRRTGSRRGLGSV